MRLRLIASLLLLVPFGSRCSCEVEPGGGDPSSDAGSHSDGSTQACLPGLESISLSPAMTRLTLNGQTPAPIAFTAQGSFAGGSVQAIDPAKLTWSATRDDDAP